MIIATRLRPRHILYYTWPSLSYFGVLSVAVYSLHHHFEVGHISLPFNAVATLSTALAIYLGFKNTHAYDRWWEARKVWGMLVNYSRAFSREVETFVTRPENGDSDAEIHAWQRRVLNRHIAFVHALRVHLRKQNGHLPPRHEIMRQPNTYDDIVPFLSAEEFKATLEKDNPPNFLLLQQGFELEYAYRRGWLSDYRFMELSRTLDEFHNHQGMCERIKNTPLPRPYSYYSWLFVHLHGTLVPFTFIEDLSWINIPLSLGINFVFHSLDRIGHTIEDPFENRISDVPLTSLSITIEANVKEAMDEPLPAKPKPINGVVF